MRKRVWEALALCGILAAALCVTAWADDREEYALIERIAIENTQGYVVSSILTESTGDVVANTDEAVWAGERVRLLTSDGSLITGKLNESAAYRNLTTITGLKDMNNDYGSVPDQLPGDFIAEEYQAGRIVRAIQQDDGTYQLLKVENQAFAKETFSINIDKEMAGIYNPSTGQSLGANEQTLFVIKDGSSYKVYRGIDNTPNVSNYVHSGTFATIAFAVFDSNDIAEILFVTNGDIDGTTKDVTFIAANSASKMMSHDEGSYYQYNAVVKGEIATIKIDSDAYLRYSAPFGFFVNQRGGRATEVFNSTLLNNVRYHNNEYLAFGEFNNKAGSRPYRLQGVQKSGNDHKIYIGTYFMGTDDNPDEWLYELSDSARIYFVNEIGDIERIAFSKIRNDKDDYAFFVYNFDSSQITDLFICAYGDPPDEEETLTPGFTTAVPVSAAPSPYTAALDYSGTPGLAAGTTCTILYGLYDENGRMVSMNTKDVTFGSDFRTELTIEAQRAGLTCRIFLTSAASHAPLAKTAQIQFTASNAA